MTDERGWKEGNLSQSETIMVDTIRRMYGWHGNNGYGEEE